MIKRLRLGCLQCCGHNPSVASSTSRKWQQRLKAGVCPSLQDAMCVLSHSDMCDSLWPPLTIAHQAPLSMGFSRQEYRSGLPLHPLEDLSDPGIEPVSLAGSCTGRQILTTWATWVSLSAFKFGMRLKNGLASVDDALSRDMNCEPLMRMSQWQWLPFFVGNSVFSYITLAIQHGFNILS